MQCIDFSSVLILEKTVVTKVIVNPPLETSFVGCLRFVISAWITANKGPDNRTLLYSIAYTYTEGSSSQYPIVITDYSDCCEYLDGLRMQYQLHCSKETMALDLMWNNRGQAITKQKAWTWKPQWQNNTLITHHLLTIPIKKVFFVLKTWLTT